MREHKIIHGPIIQTNSRMIYSITLLSGHIITSPDGFAIEDTLSMNNVDKDNWPYNEENVKNINRQEMPV
jgi:hypothetical protein